MLVDQIIVYFTLPAFVLLMLSFGRSIKNKLHEQDTQKNYEDLYEVYFEIWEQQQPAALKEYIKAYGKPEHDISFTHMQAYMIGYQMARCTYGDNYNDTSS
jgi:hypothetical protein